MILLLLAASGMMGGPTNIDLKPAQKTVSQAVDKSIAASVAQQGSSGGDPANKTPEVMLIQPGERSNDIVQAFNYIKIHSVTSKFEVTLTTGDLISNILSMQTMPSGTMIIFEVSTLQGNQYR